MDEVSYAQTPCQSLPTEPNAFSVSAVPLEKSSSSSPLGRYKVQGIQGEKDNFLNFSYPLYSHRREKSLRINIDSGMHLFAGFVSEEEGFPRENGGGPEVPALGRQPWVALGKDELSGNLVPQWGHPSPIQLAFSMGILQEKPVLRLWLDPPQSRGAGAARPPARRTAENIGPEAFCWRLGVPRRAPGRTRSPAGGARSARAAGPCCWGRRCSPRVRT